MLLRRLYAALLVLITFVICTNAHPDPARKPIPFGVAQGGAQAAAAVPQSNTKDSVDDGGATNYLVTLARTVSNQQKDKLLDVLLNSGAVVKQVYDYRVYKGVLFQVPPVHDKGLDSWSTKLLAVDGVRAVEEDSIVKTT